MPPADATAPPAAVPEAEPPSPDRRRSTFTLALTGLMMVLAMSTLDGNIVSPALPRIVADLGGVSHIAWVLTAALLTSTTSTPLYGKLSDIYGRKPLFAVAIGLFLLGSVLSGIAQSMTGLIIARAIQGLGAGGLLTLSQITLSDLVPPSRRAKYQGLFAAVFAACSIIGAPLGGVITQTLSWRWIFFVNIPFGIAAIVLLWLTITERPRGARHKIDYAGIMVVTGATAAALLALSLGGSVYPWMSPLILGLFVASGLLFVLLIGVERRSEDAVIQLSLFSNRIYAVAAIVNALVSTAVFSAMAFLPLFLQVVLGMSPAASGVMVTPIVVGVLIGLFAGGQIITKIGRYRRFAVTGTGLSALSLAALAILTLIGTGPVPIAIAMVGVGLGLGMMMPSLTVAMQNAVSEATIGVATSVANFMRSLGTALGVGVVGAIIMVFAGPALSGGGSEPAVAAILEQGMQALAGASGAERLAVVDGYRRGVMVTFWVAAAIAAIAFVIVLGLKDKPLRSKSDGAVAAR